MKSAIILWVRVCFFVLQYSLVFVLSGCYGDVLAPRPSSPENYFSVSIDSIPSGARIYSLISEDGSLKSCEGETPMSFKIGYARMRTPEGKLCFVCNTLYEDNASFGDWFNHAYFWFPNDLVRDVNFCPFHCEKHVLLNCRILKDGYLPANIQNKLLWVLNAEHQQPEDFRITIPLEPISEPAVIIDVPNRPKNEQQQQQQQQQQQTVVIPGMQGESQSTGTVMISSNVEGVDVYVDGVFVGNAPANLKLKDGIHIIEVKKNNYSTYRKELRVFSGSELSLRVELSN